MEVWSDRGSTCTFRNARSAFRNLHVDPLSLHTSMRKQTSRIQSLYLHFYYFIKIVPFWLRNIRFLIQNTRSLFYGRHYSSLHRLMLLHRKLNVKFFLMFIVAENTGSVNIYKWKQKHLASESILKPWRGTIKGDRWIFVNFWRIVTGYASPFTSFCMENMQQSLPDSGVHK